MPRAKTLGPGATLAKIEQEKQVRAISARIEQARVAAGHDNASDFARRCGVTPHTVYRWETRQHGRLDKKGRQIGLTPDVISLHAIARECGVSMEWLVTGAAPEAAEQLAAWLRAREADKRPVTEAARVWLTSVPVLYGYAPRGDHYFDTLLLAFESGLSRSDAVRSARLEERGSTL